jgi:hypothetical protein
VLKKIDKVIMSSTPIAGQELMDGDLEEKWTESTEDIKAIDPGK